MAANETEIEQAILAQKKWADLDNRMRDLIGSTHEYDNKISSYSIQNQLRYRGNLVRFVINNEYEYYRKLLKYSKKHLMLFPYHLSDFIISEMRITPFQYYLSVMTQLLDQQKSYDTLPNFTAADCLRLLGIGRNQYIDTMNELRSTYTGFLGWGAKRDPRSLLPSKPVENVPIEPWWFISAGYITDDDVKTMVSPEEKPIIDRLVSPGGLNNQILACDLDEAIVRSLYLKGLVYLEVPIYDDDYIIVPPLEGFVMNRVTGDYFETLLYKIFVSIDQNTTVKELSSILEIDIRLVKNAVSMYCRLKFAYKKIIYVDTSKFHSSWRDKFEEYQKLGISVAQPVLKPSRHVADFLHELASTDEHDHGTEMAETPMTAAVTDPNFQPFKNQKDGHAIVQSPSTILSSPQSLSSPPATTSTGARKLVLFYDSNLAAFLMMGNLSPKLKTHAVTMFEVGKLSDEWVDSLLEELSKISNDNIDEDGYEAKRYYIHALMLHRTIQFIRSGLDLGNYPDRRLGLDLIRVESLSTLDIEPCERFLKKNYQMIISVAPLNHDVKLNAAIDLPHLGPGSPIINSLWFRLYMYYKTRNGPTSLLLLQGYRLTKLPDCLANCETLLLNYWNRDPTCVFKHNALNAINDALTRSPILVQAYPIQPIGGNLINSEEKVFVPLPLMSSKSCNDTNGDNKADDKGDVERDTKIEDLEQVPAVKKLSECLNLTKICGYITLLRSTEAVKKLIKQNSDNNCLMGSHRRREEIQNIDMNCDQSSSDKEGSDTKFNDDTHNQDQGNDALTLFDCNFGIPLFDRFLNKQVRNRISCQNLMDPESLTQLLKATKELSSEIESFVNSHRTNKEVDSIEAANAADQRHFFRFPETERFKCPIPRPAENLLFKDGELSVFRDLLLGNL